MLVRVTCRSAEDSSLWNLKPKDAPQLGGKREVTSATHRSAPASTFLPVQGSHETLLLDHDLPHAAARRLIN